MSDVLNGTDVMEETINGEDEWIVLAPRSAWCLIAILLRKETNHNNNTLNIFLSIRLVPFPPNLITLTKRS